MATFLSSISRASQCHSTEKTGDDRRGDLSTGLLRRCSIPDQLPRDSRFTINSPMRVSSTNRLGLAGSGRMVGNPDRTPPFASSVRIGGWLKAGFSELGMHQVRIGGLTGKSEIWERSGWGSRFPRCPNARHLGQPSSLVVLTSPGTWPVAYSI